MGAAQEGGPVNTLWDDHILVKPLRGDGAYSMAHLREQAN